MKTCFLKYESFRKFSFPLCLPRVIDPFCVVTLEVTVDEILTFERKTKNILSNLGFQILGGQICLTYRHKLNVVGYVFYLILLLKLCILCKSDRNINEYYAEIQVCPLIQISGM